MGVGFVPSFTQFALSQVNIDKRLDSGPWPYSIGEYGGELLKRRAGRKSGRPLSTRETMHLVLHSTKATGMWCFLKPRNDKNVRRIVAKFSAKYGVCIVGIGNSGNHLHIQLKLTNRFTYRAFIRAVTGAIAMAVSGRDRWSVNDGVGWTQAGDQTGREQSDFEKRASRFKFWDHRPYTRVAKTFTEYLKLKDYVRINELEGLGNTRTEARAMIAAENRYALSS